MPIDKISSSEKKSKHKTKLTRVVHGGVRAAGDLCGSPAFRHIVQVDECFQAVPTSIMVPQAAYVVICAVYLIRQVEHRVPGENRILSKVIRHCLKQSSVLQDRL